MKWKHFPRYWPFVQGIQRSPVNSPHKGQWRGALVYSLICVWINGWENNREAGDLRCHRAHYDVIVIHAGTLYQYVFYFILQNSSYCSAVYSTVPYRTVLWWDLMVCLRDGGRENSMANHCGSSDALNGQTGTSICFRFCPKYHLCTLHRYQEEILKTIYKSILAFRYV